MIPILFDSNSTSWGTFGIGVLSGAISCIAEENRNGAYELEMEYPVTGALFDEIRLRNIIVAKPNYTDDPQPFRIYSISKPINGIVTINAQHISYDLSGYVEAPFVAQGVQNALIQIKNAATIYPQECPFSFSSDMSGDQEMCLKHPASTRSLMGGIQGSFLDIYGGEWHFDGYNCELKSARGANRGVVIRYGLNMTDLKQEANVAEVYTAVYPYYYNSDTETLVMLPEKVIQAEGNFGYSRVYNLDLSNEFLEVPSEDMLRARAQRYIEENSLTTPKVNLKVDFVQLDKLSERVDLCDTVSVRFDKLGVSATAKCIRTKWDVLKDRYEEVELGSARNSLAATIAKTRAIKQEIEEHSSQFQATAGMIADKVTGNRGGHIMLHDTDNDGEPDEFLIMDTDDISTAVRIIRINNGGIAFSRDGYNGTYRTAWNIAGEFVADFIASGELKADLVKIMGDNNFYWDSANITMVSPTDPNKMIRFGKYDGTNYGLGFSTDGGVTWMSGFDFGGIRVLSDSGTGANIKIVDNCFTITDQYGVLITCIGYAESHLEDGTVGLYPIFNIGSYSDKDEDGNEYTFTEAHGANSFMAGSSNIPAGQGCTCVGSGNVSLGNYSIAIGRWNKSKNSGSIALGIMCTVSGVYAAAIGHYCNVPGNYSFAFGDGCEAHGNYALVGGRLSKALKDYGVALGNTCSCSKDYGIATGYFCNASDSFGIAIGDACNSGGSYCIAIGQYCVANGINTMAIGCHNETDGSYCIAIGQYCVANGINTMAIGCHNETDGYYSRALGRYCSTINSDEVVIGRYNATTTDGMLTVGIGSETARSNAMKLNHQGNLWIAGYLTQNSDSRLKEILGDVPIVKQIRAVRYKWNDKKISGDKSEHIGYIAQDVEKVAPYLVIEDDNGYKSLDYIGLLCAKVEYLEQTVDRLLTKLTAAGIAI